MCVRESHQPIYSIIYVTYRHGKPLFDLCHAHPSGRGPILGGRGGPRDWYETVAVDCGQYWTDYVISSFLFCSTTRTVQLTPGPETLLVSRSFTFFCRPSSQDCVSDPSSIPVFLSYLQQMLHGIIFGSTKDGRPGFNEKSWLASIRTLPF